MAIIGAIEDEDSKGGSDNTDLDILGWVWIGIACSIVAVGVLALCCDVKFCGPFTLLGNIIKGIL
jgi:hypothetical protein